MQNESGRTICLPNPLLSFLTFSHRVSPRSTLNPFPPRFISSVFCPRAFYHQTFAASVLHASPSLIASSDLYSSPRFIVAPFSSSSHLPLPSPFQVYPPLIPASWPPSSSSSSRSQEWTRRRKGLHAISTFILPVQVLCSSVTHEIQSAVRLQSI